MKLQKGTFRYHLALGLAMNMVLVGVIVLHFCWTYAPIPK